MKTNRKVICSSSAVRYAETLFELKDVEIRKAVYSYAFEDNYPKAGDYDFNDIVLNVTLPVACNEVTELKYVVDLQADVYKRQLIYIFQIFRMGYRKGFDNFYPHGIQ